MCDLLNPDERPTAPSRRALFASAAAAVCLAAGVARAEGPRVLALYHTHTGRRLRVTYAADGQLIPAALAEIKKVIRSVHQGRGQAAVEQALAASTPAEVEEVLTSALRHDVDLERFARRMRHQ